MSKKKIALTSSVDVEMFRQHDWLKTQMMAFCRDNQLSAAGSKEELTERIEKHLTVGERKVRRRVMSEKVRKTRPKRSKQKLENPTLNTLITPEFRGSQNNRQLFRQHLGNDFRFNARLMSWIRANVGKTYREAINEYKRLKEEKLTGQQKPLNSPQAIYNRFLRDYRAKNPDVTFKEAIAAWYQHKRG